VPAFRADLSLFRLLASRLALLRTGCWLTSGRARRIMGATPRTTTEIIALAILRHAIRGRALGGGRLTYRRALPGIIPGQRLTIDEDKRWLWRKTEMIGGTLLHAGFSLRALQQAGFALPRRGAEGLMSPGDGDERLRDGLLAHDAGQWPLARCLLLEVLEEHPACLPAHAALGQLLAELEHRDLALTHLTAAVRLGLGALSGDGESLPLDPTRETERSLLFALTGRAHLLASMGRTEDAAADLRRALAWDPSDAGCAAGALARLERSADVRPRMAAGSRP